MASNINLRISNWRATGLNRQIPQREITVRWDWNTNAGVPSTYQRTFTFPDDLALLPASWVSEIMEELVVRASRRHAGVDD